MTVLLGIDIGTSGTKALICDERGRVKATTSEPHPISSPRPGWSEQNPQDWWTAVCRATRKVLADAQVDPSRVTGIGLSGQMHGSVFLDRAGKVLRPAILWNDQRTQTQCDEIEHRAGGRRRLIEMVANPALTGFTAPKVLWLRSHEPRVYSRMRKLLLPKDYIRYRMTGDFATEVSDASGMLLLDVARRTWSDKLLNMLDIDPSLLGELYESIEITGTLSASAARSMGLVPGIPVVGGAGDQAAGAVGNGIVTRGIVSATIGTSGVVFAHSDKPVRDPQGRVHTMCHAVPGKWCVFGCMLSAGASLQWFKNNLGEAELAAARKRGVDAYDLLMREAEKSPAGCEGLFFLPYLTGERCPHPDPHARGAWIGLTSRTTRPMMIRALLEGVTFGMRDAMEIMRAMGISMSQVRASGGGARSRFWRQLQADTYGTKIVTTNASEGPAYGAALLAGVGTGVWGGVEAACRECIRTKQTINPDARSRAQYGKRFAIYDKLYWDLRERFADLS